MFYRRHDYMSGLAKNWKFKAGFSVTVGIMARNVHVGRLET